MVEAVLAQVMAVAVIVSGLSLSFYSAAMVLEAITMVVAVAVAAAAKNKQYNLGCCLGNSL